MTSLLVPAIIGMVCALTFYTIGVWLERFSGRLKGIHLAFFWFGWVFDTTGTTLMTQMAGKVTLNFHSVTGLLAIVLMFGHAVWASVALFRRQENVLKNFHKFSILVWAIWLIPFVSGLIAAMVA